MIIDLFIATAASILMAGAGQFVLNRIIQKEQHYTWNIFEHVSYAFVCGIWLWMTLLIPTMLNGVSTGSITVFLIIVIVTGLAGLTPFRKISIPRFSQTSWLLIPVIIWLLPYLIHSLLPNAGWDSAELHLPLGKLFIQKGNLFTHPVYYKFAITGGIQQIYGVFQYFQAKGAIIPFNFLAYLATLSLVFGWSKRRYGTLAAWFSLGTLASISILSELAMEPRIDGFLALFTGVTLVITADYIEKPENKDLLALIALSLGAGLAVKYTVLIPTAVVAIAITIRATISRHFPIKSIIIAVLLLSAPSAFWYARNYIQLNDPVYPFLNQRKYPDATGKGLDYPIKIETQRFLDSLDSTHPINLYYTEQIDQNERPNVPTNALDIFSVIFHASDYTRKSNLTISPLLIFFLGLPLIRRRPLDWCLWLTALSGYFVLGTQTYLIRYLVPIFPAMAIGAGAVLAYPAKNRYLITTFIAAIIGLTGINSIRSWQRLYDTDAMSLLSGAITESVWLQEIGYNNSRELLPAIDKLNILTQNKTITSQDILLMVGEGKGDRLLMKYIPDGSWNGHLWQYLWLLSGDNEEQLLGILKQMKVTYIMYNPTLYQWVMRSTDTNIKSIAFTHITITKFMETYCSSVFVTPQITVVNIQYPKNFEPSKNCPDPSIGPLPQPFILK